MPSRLSKDFIKSVKEHSLNNIASILKEYVDLRPFGENKYQIMCINPEHLETKPSMVVNELWNNAYCFGCQQQYDSIGVAQLFRDLNFYEAVKYLCERAGIPFSDSGISPEDLAREEMRSRVRVVVGAAVDFYHRKLFSNEGNVAREYLKNRGFSKKIAEEFKLGWGCANPKEFIAYMRGKFSDEEIFSSDVITLSSDRRRLNVKMNRRVVIPLFDEFGHPVSLAGRIVGEGEPKYLNTRNSAVYEKGNFIFNLNKAKKHILKEKCVILTEGYFDVIRAWQNGFYNLISCSSNTYTKDMFKRMRKLTDKLVSCMDSDAGGRTGIKRIFENSFGMGFLFRIVELPESYDVDDFLKDRTPFQFKTLVENSIGVTHYRINRIFKNRLKSEEEMARAYRAAVLVLSEEAERPIRNKYIKEVADKFKLNEEEVKDDVEHKIKAPRMVSKPSELSMPGYVINEKKILSAIMNGKAGLVVEKISPEQFVDEKFGLAAKYGYRIVSEKSPITFDDVEDEEVKSLIMQAYSEKYSDSDEQLVANINSLLEEYKERRLQFLTSQFEEQAKRRIPADVESKEYKEFQELQIRRIKK